MMPCPGFGTQVTSERGQRSPGCYNILRGLRKLQRQLQGELGEIKGLTNRIATDACYVITPRTYLCRTLQNNMI